MIEIRTMVEEMRFNQALGYAWGVEDGSGYRKKVDSIAFANWYSVIGHTVGNLYRALEFFRTRAPDAQMELGERHRKAPASLNLNANV